MTALRVTDGWVGIEVLWEEGCCYFGGMNEVGRRKPSPGVRIELGEPTILFLTVCAVRPASWLATEVVRESLVKIWRERLMC